MGRGVRGPGQRVRGPHSDRGGHGPFVRSDRKLHGWSGQRSNPWQHKVLTRIVSHVILNVCLLV